MKSDMMSNKSSAKAAQSVIGPEEYDFSEVSQSGLRSCLYYEYMRESKAIINEVSKARRQIVQEFKRQNLKIGDDCTINNLRLKKVTKHQGILFEGGMIVILASYAEFPGVPWQKLSGSDKERLRDFVGRASQMHNAHFRKVFPPLVMDTFLKTPSLGNTTLSDWKSRTTPKRCLKIPAHDRDKTLISGFFQINTLYPADLLIDDFRDWLQVHHPKGREKMKERRGRDSMRDPLNALGALRLRYHCRTLGEAQKLIAPLESKPHGMRYGDRTAWNRACDAAVKHFARLLQLPDDQPIHFTKGWQK